MGLVQPRRGPRAAMAPGGREGPALPARRRPPALGFGLARRCARYRGHGGCGGAELAPLEGPWAVVAPRARRCRGLEREPQHLHRPSSSSAALFSRAGTLRRSSAHSLELAGLSFLIVHVALVLLRSSS